ncbi:PQQ-dependent sugar dehydrogenase [Xylella fastidiosa]|uniref:Sorbosone dehydrogenase family protein n=1 Tax=Xylella fastidiosa TaxID=2371 RepID=A0ABC8ADX2_XYLFS|nr:sorbosone dehydrogenase family protein [Xylella fastidiosa]ALR06549.1 sorbosone dehydrogenase family protein [Xylella fastidiosa]AWG45232.1 dehydrogenase [Xylella fastidiosa]WGZ35204.1 sorbosone dehydrogenase family protein [Xylella fastidiosa subsp. pauca]WGZ37478.1 sorbosone dehydrogenase family protein [Xylella fastidiosa subsp. pauca]
MKPMLIALTLQALLLAGAAPTALAQAAPDTVRIQNTTPRDWSMQVVSSDLDYPWDIARDGDRLLLTEKAGHIVVIEGGRQQRYPLQASDAIASEGGAGLLGIALSRDFAQSGIAYLYHSYRAGDGLANKIIQARFDGKVWRETRVLVSGIPGHRLYNGGSIAIGPDGHLYATTGWTANRERPQDVGSLAGKVLRMTLDGQAPKDNPFPGSLVYSLGHRNPQGLAWNPAGQLFVVEHGESGHDEINRIKPGANYGWPLAQGTERREGTEPAWIESGRSTWAPAGAAFVGDELLVAALGARALLVVDERAKALKPIFDAGDRIRDVLPAGRDLYVITTNRSPRAEGPSKDRLLKLTLAR